MIEKILEGDIRTVSRALSLIEEDGGRRTWGLLKSLYTYSSNSLVIGITGGTGTGKSTLAEGLAHEFLKTTQKVGIIAVDPTSPFSGGAILGDRIRMQSLATNPNVFIRSMATRGRLGGLSAAVNDALVVLGAAGYEVLLVETVGVGQDEVDIAETADVTVVVLVPGMGDDVQSIKAGIMEIGDVFVLNKADRDGAEKARLELDALCSLLVSEQGWIPPIVETVATEKQGLSELVSAIFDFKSNVLKSESRLEQRIDFCRSRLVDLLRDRLVDEILSKIGSADLNHYAERMAAHELDPYSAVEELVKLTEL